MNKEKIRGIFNEIKTEAKGILSDAAKEMEPEYIAAAILTLILVLYVYFTYVSTPGSKAYIAGVSKDTVVYTIEEQSEDEAGGTEMPAAVETGRLRRGTEIEKYNSVIETGDAAYVKIKDRTAALRSLIMMLPRGNDRSSVSDGYEYVAEGYLSDSKDDLVRETEVYVRTPATIYAEEDGPAIASFAAKGTCLKVTGYDMMNEDGSVNKYKVEYTEDDVSAEGYVYGKYMTDTQEKADAVYNENGIYDRVKKDNYGMKLYGGKAKHLDYYPYEKPEIEGNEFCRDARAMYLNCAAVVHPEKYIDIINDTDCNAVVCDIKDGVLAYESDAAKELSPRSYKTAYVSKEEYKEGIDALRESGVYLIGRIVVFNDPIYAEDHPETCIIWGSNTGWPSPYSREVWEYNVRLAREAVEEFGFNEIQFDYVRFPENSYEMSREGSAKFRNKYDEEKGQAVQNFCFYAADQIHEAGAYLSVDVFGESVYGYMTAYGQYWPAISNIADAVSAMPYTDHTGGDGAWADPYGTIKTWAKRAKKMQDYLETPAAARTWITGYDTPYWAPTEDYGEKELKAQANALKEQGLDGGFIPWNAASSLSKYRQYKDVWNTE